MIARQRATTQRPRFTPPPTRWTSLVGTALNCRNALRIRKLNDTAWWTANTARIQARQLRGLLLFARNTEFGRGHGFAKVLGTRDDRAMIEAYRAETPIADWYAFQKQIARMREEAEPNVLWPGVVEHYAQTSGTTAGDKFIPVSREMMRSNFAAALDIFANASRFGVSMPFILCGRVLFLGGSTDVSISTKGIRTGDLSGLVTPMIRWPLTQIYSPGRDIALMSHWPSKIDAMARSCIDQDIRMITGMPSWTLVLFERVLELAKERGLAASCIREVWPNLTVLVHGGVKYAPFDARVRTLYSGSPEGDDVPVRLELYPASEGFIAMQDTPGEPGLRLLADIGNFYEFVPLEEIDNPAARAFTCDAVEKGQKYVVVMCTCAGLWRYIIGDVVEFDTIPAGLDGRGGNGPCRLRIVGRHRHFINAFGENLIVEHIENAVAAAAARAAVIVGEFTAAPIYAGKGRRAGLELLVEVSDASLRSERLGAFAAEFDASLKQQNVDYTTKRTDDVGMAPPTITVVEHGTFHRWLESKGKLGGQHKCPRCANHREIIDGVLKAAAKT